MSELYLCNDSIAALPYYVESLSINLYSIEELAYYILSDIYLLDKGFMNEELCSWVERELKLPKLGERLRDIMRSNGLLSGFISCILQESGYCSGEEIQEVLFVIRELEEKSEFECSKIRADRLMENDKYIASIYEYKQLLKMDEAEAENPMLIGNIWHNLGVAYARLFLFEEAVNCFKEAYARNGKKESLKECLFAYRCMRDELGFSRLALESGLSDEEISSIKNELTCASRNENIKVFEESLEQIAKLNEYGNKEEYQNAISEIILKWKDDYRRNCKL